MSLWWGIAAYLPKHIKLLLEQFSKQDCSVLKTLVLTSK